MDKKRQWANEILNSLEGVTRATPNDNLFDKITAKIPNKKESKIITLKQIRWVAVAASVVIAVNIYVLKLQNDSINSTTEKIKNQISLLSDYTF